MLDDRCLLLAISVIDLIDSIKGTQKKSACAVDQAEFVQISIHNDATSIVYKYGYLESLIRTR